VTVRAPHFGTLFGTHSPTTRTGDNSRPRVCCFFEMERTGIEPVTSDLQISGFEPRLGQVRSVNAKLRRLREVEIGYSGTRFLRAPVPVSLGRGATGRPRSRAHIHRHLLGPVHGVLSNLGPVHGVLSASVHRGTNPPTHDQQTTKGISPCSPGDSPGSSLSAPRPSRSRAVPTASSPQPPAEARAPRQQPLPPRHHPGDPRSAAADPTLGLDRPQGEQSARSPACPRRASLCRHQRVSR
jgi:hypothetical protein